MLLWFFIFHFKMKWISSLPLCQSYAANSLQPIEYLEWEPSCLLLCHIRWYKKHGKIQFLFSVPHLECNVWLCHMLSRADQLWLLNTLYPSERDPISHFKRLGGREQSLPRVRRRNGVESAVGKKPLLFTLVLQCLHGLLQEASPCSIRLPQRELSDGMFTQRPQRQGPYLDSQLGREDSPGC